MTPDIEFLPQAWIALEGGDGVGKNTLARETADLLVESGYDVLYLDYPTYWSPFGHMLRAMLSNEQSKTYLDSLEPYREAQVRAAMFAMERAFTISLILNALEELGESTVVVSDRGPHSNAVTAAYLLAQGKLDNELLDDYVKYVLLEVDREYLELFSPHSILCVSDSHAAGVENREFRDHYEAEPVQQRILRVYEMMVQDKIQTRENGVWRDANEMAREVASKAKIDLKQNSERGHFIELSPLYLFNKLKVPDQYLAWYISGWEHIDKDYDPLNRKNIIRRMNELVATSFERHLSVSEIDLSVFRKFPHSSVVMKRLMECYPEILVIADMIFPQNGGFSKFINRIARLHNS